MTSNNLVDIRAVVAIDFGTTYSTFAYASKSNPDSITVNHQWFGRKGLPRTITALLYDAKCNKVLRWGELAFVHENVVQGAHFIERFKLHLDDTTEQKPELPPMLDYKKAITDYLTGMKSIIDETLNRRWPELKLDQVLFVLPVSAELPLHKRAILRDCAIKAGIIPSNIETTTKCEAATIYCLSTFNEHSLTEDDTFLVVKCGDRSVDLTVHTLLAGNKLQEDPIRTGGLCGSTFVDDEFVKFLGRKFGIKDLKEFKEQAYGDLKRLIRLFFCYKVKLPFTGNPEEFEPIELDLEMHCPDLLQYITGEARDKLEDDELVIDLEYDDVKKMFDPVVNEIVKLIDEQLPPQRKVKTIFLIGSFSESTYLFNRVKETFKNRVPNISIPPNPSSAVVIGAVSCGLMQIDSRNIGTEVKEFFNESNINNVKCQNPIEDKVSNTDNSVEYDIRVVVGLDFGTTYSGFAYRHVSENTSTCSNDSWHGEVVLKTNTVLQYDEEYNNVVLWGAPALAKRPTRRRNTCGNNKPVELFKLHLGDLLDEFKPSLPVEYEKAITDYLREIGKVIRGTVTTHWPKIEFPENVLVVLPVPVEFSEKSKAIMRRCAYNAGLIKEKYSTNLQFTTEPEAAAIHCMETILKEPGINFMIVDCGGGTVDLTTRKLLKDKQLDEITESAGDFCGSSFIDDELIKYLREKLGDEPMDLLRDNNYGQMQYMIQQFCKYGKVRFTGDDEDFLYELDIQETVPILKQYITNPDIIKALDDDDCDWVIGIDLENMKLLFEPVIERILCMITIQLDNCQETCSEMFLVGGFSESKYLQKRIKEEFNDRVDNISVPVRPIAAIAHGAVAYGFSIKDNLGNDGNMKCVISSRKLKYTYGTDVRYKLMEGYVDKFNCLARRGTIIEINQEKTETYEPKTYKPVHPDQKTMIFKIYYTREYDPIYCNEPGVKLLGKFTIDLPGSGLDRTVLFGIAFGQMEITATSKDKQTGQSRKITLKVNFDNFDY